MSFWLRVLHFSWLKAELVQENREISFWRGLQPPTANPTRHKPLVELRARRWRFGLPGSSGLQPPRIKAAAECEARILRAKRLAGPKIWINCSPKMKYSAKDTRNSSNQNTKKKNSRRRQGPCFNKQTKTLAEQPHLHTCWSNYSGCKGIVSFRTCSIH